MEQRWPHQIRGVQETLSAIERGENRICVTSPTGGGKTNMMRDMARHYLDQGRKVSLYTNRRMLVDQTSNVLIAAGMYHGVRAAGYEDEREHDFQVSSIQTEYSRVLKRQRWNLHAAELVLIDECHQQTSDMARKLMDAHVGAGAVVIGFTATPIDLADHYDHLIIAGTNSELRDCGALVWANHFGPNEPDTHKLKVAIGQDFTERQQIKAMGMDYPGRRKFLFASVLKSFRELNPEGKPSILFAPGVAESLWFAQEFQAAGLSAAHIDGDEIWVDGKIYKSDRETRDDLAERSKDGSIQVVCNRFVLREGIDWPWLAHGIAATIFGSLQSNLQALGRLLRAYHGLEGVCKLTPPV